MLAWVGPTRVECKKVGHNLHPDIITFRDEITRKVKCFDNFIPNAFPYDRWY